MGKPLRLKLIENKNNVYVLEKKSTNRKIFLKKKPKKIIIGDFRNKKIIQKIIKKNKINVIFHLGAITQVLDSLKNPLETHETNIMGTINFLESIRKIRIPIVSKALD